MDKYLFAKVFIAMFVALFLASCSNDEEPVTDEEDNPANNDNLLGMKKIQIHYEFSANKDFHKFYHFLASYKDINGQPHTDTIPDTGWCYADEALLTDETSGNFMCVVQAVRKEELPELTAFAYTIGYEQDVRITIINPADDNEAHTIEGGPIKSWSWQGTPAGLKEFLDSTPSVALIDFAYDQTEY